LEIRFFGTFFGWAGEGGVNWVPQCYSIALTLLGRGVLKIWQCSGQVAGEGGKGGGGRGEDDFKCRLYLGHFKSRLCLRIFSDPEKEKEPKPACYFFSGPEASLFPQRHRDWVSRLTEGMPGGPRKKSNG
jgi:hypothetical protein